MTLAKNSHLTGVLALSILSFQFVGDAAAQSPTPSVREIPARTLPVPDTVSPQMQAVIARPPNPAFNATPETTAEWKARVEQAARAVNAGLPKLREWLGVTVEPATFAGVKAFVVTRLEIELSPRLADEIIAFVTSKCGRYQSPREIQFVDSLPKTHSGKIQRFLLRQVGLDGKISR